MQQLAPGKQRTQTPSTIIDVQVYLDACILFPGLLRTPVSRIMELKGLIYSYNLQSTSQSKTFSRYTTSIHKLIDKDRQATFRPVENHRGIYSKKGRCA